jgi:hypothetical protein
MPRLLFVLCLLTLSVQSAVIEYGVRYNYTAPSRGNESHVLPNVLVDSIVRVLVWGSSNPDDGNILLNATVQGPYFINTFFGYYSGVFDAGSTCPFSTAPIDGLVPVSIEYSKQVGAQISVEFHQVMDMKLMVNGAAKPYDVCSEQFASNVFYFDVTDINHPVSVTVSKNVLTAMSIIVYIKFNVCDP